MAIPFIEGLLKVANVALSIIAGYIAISLFGLSERRELKSWKILAFALLFFMIQEILGALRAFGLFKSDYLTHIVPTIIIGLLIYALALQIHITLVEK